MLVRLALRSRTLARVPRPRECLVAFQAGHSILRDTSSRQGVRNYWWSTPVVAEPAKTVPLESIGQPIIAQVLPTDASISEVVIPPLQHGDFAALGLASMWPPGIMCWSFEWLQVTTGIPWFYTIVAGTLFWRGVLIPAALSGMHNAALLRPYSGQLKDLDEKMQRTKDRAILMELTLKKQALIAKAGLSLKQMFLVPMISMVGNLSLFLAIKRMVALPVIQLTQSGVSLLPDLTLTGDYMMPTLVLLAMNVQFSLMKHDMDPTKPVMAHVMNALRVFGVVTLPMMSWMPVGLWLSVFSGTLLGIVQSSLLRVPRIRQAVGLPPVQQMQAVTMRDTAREILGWYHRKKMEAIASQRKPDYTSLPKASRRR